MLPPDYLQDCTLQAEEIASEIKREIIDGIVERILLRRKENLDYLLTASDITNIEVLTDSGILLSDIQQRIAKKSGLMEKEISKAIKDGGYKSAKYDQELYDKVGLKGKGYREFTRSPAFIRLMESNYALTKGVWKNFCDTTVKSSQRIFVNALDKAYNEITAGNESLDGAFLKAIRAIYGGSDSPTVSYPSGRKMSLEAATLMCLRTGVSKVAAKTTELRMDEMGVDLVITTSHFDARPEHQKWQGKVFSRYPNHPKYKFLGESQDNGGTGYGSVTGLCGANCRHSFMPYFEGQKINFPRYNKKENKEAYELTQKQRDIERRIRRAKLEKASAEKVLRQLGETESELAVGVQDDIRKLDQRIKRLQKGYFEFCKKNDLRPLGSRLVVARADNTPNKVKETLKQAIRIERDYDSPIMTKNSRFNGFTKEVYDQYCDLLDSYPDSNTKQLYVLQMNNAVIADANSDNSYHRNGILFFNQKDDLNKNIKGIGETFFHELGHWIDHRASNLSEERWWNFSTYYKDGLFGKTLKDECEEVRKKWERKVRAEMKKEGIAKPKIDDVRDRMYEQMEELPDYEKHAISDLISGASLLKVEFNWGHHSKRYWSGIFNYTMDEKRPLVEYRLGSEGFAEFSQAVLNGPESLERIKQVLPKSFQVYEEMVEEMLRTFGWTKNTES